MLKKCVIGVLLVVGFVEQSFAVDQQLLTTVYRNCVGYNIEQNVKNFADAKKSKEDSKEDKESESKPDIASRAQAHAEAQCKAVYERCVKEPEGMLCKMHVKNYTEVFLPKVPIPEPTE